MGKRKYVRGLIIFVLFIISLYLVDYSRFGSSEVAKYNNGYGTVDMKSYDNEIVYDVLSGMTEDGIKVYKTYYGVDAIFIICFGVFQCFITLQLFNFAMKGARRFFICILPIIRGICDIIENALLYITLCTYPNINVSLVGTANIFTFVKLWTIRLWIVEIIAGIVIRIICKIRKNEHDN